APDAEIITFPAWDCMPYDRASPSSSIMARRMRALAQLASGNAQNRIVLTTAGAAIQYLPPRQVMAKVALSVAKGQSIARDALVAALVAQGYRRAGKAMEPGEFALRGSIIDIMAPGMSEGVRIDFFGDEVESLKPFDPLSQI